MNGKVFTSTGLNSDEPELEDYQLHTAGVKNWTGYNHEPTHLQVSSFYLFDYHRSNAAIATLEKNYFLKIIKLN